MKTLTINQINPIKMSVSPPAEIVEAGYKCICDGEIYHYVGIGWVNCGKAEENDYQNIPEVK
jgi:hypothetical protein